MKARLKRLLISPDVLFHIWETGTSWQVKQGIPPGSRVRGFTLDPNSQCLNVFVENEIFDEVNIETEIASTLQTLFKKL